MTADTLLKRRRLILTLLVVLALLAPSVLDGNDITPAIPDATDTCPVCGMLVQPHQDWLAQVRLADGSTMFFEGAKDMFRYLQAPERYAKDKQGVKVLGGFVTSYSDKKPIPIDQAWFVIGSDVRGPAGEELVALRSLVQANEFILKHDGTRLLRADDVSPDLLAQLP